MSGFGVFATIGIMRRQIIETIKGWLS